MALLQRINRRLLLAPFSTAVIDDQRSWKGATLYAASLHLASEIARTSKAPRIGVMLPTSGMFPVAALAAWTLGRCIVPLNYLQARDELDYVIADAELDAVVTVAPMVEMVGGLPEHIRQIRLDAMRFGGVPRPRLSHRFRADDVIVLLYTSGTSGKPKGVMLTEGNLQSNIDQCVDWAQFTRRDVMLGVLPQFHSFGLTILTLLPMAVGCRVIFTARFVPRRIVDLLRKHRPTALVAIPSMYNALRSTKKAGSEDFQSLRYAVSGGEPLPDAVFDGFLERFGVTINEGYGLTETAPVANWCRPSEHRRKSVGPALPGVQERIVSPDGRVLGVDEEGEVRIKGPNVMKGYFKLPDLTASVFDDDGWFRTGDMGRFDREGNLYITGRIKEMLIIGGENVFPREIEEVLNGHPSVQDSAVVGVEDPTRGEVAVAVVELKDGAVLDVTALRTHCRDRLAQFKVPREILGVAALPRNPTGKILRRRVKEQYLAGELGARSAAASAGDPPTD